jgi:uncharacterized protein YndB with AHSA1/START domain
MSNPEFVYVTYIDTTPDTLWRALTKAEFTRQYWMGNRVESDWKEGSPITFRRDDGKTPTITGKILRYNPPHELSYTWVFPGEHKPKEEPSRVTFKLERTDNVVKLTVIHDRFAPGSTLIASVSDGWPAVLSSLKSLLENGKPITYSSWKNCG